MIDRAYATKLADTVVKNAVESTMSFHISMDDLIRDFNNMRNTILGIVLTKLWDQLLESCRAYNTFRPLLSFERALACLVRKGVDSKHLSLKIMEATVSPGTFHYDMRKEGTGFSSCPSVRINMWNRLPMRWITLSGEEFADFLFEFDSLVGTFTQKVDRYLLGLKQKALQYEILCESIELLGEQYLKPLGIQWSVGTSFTEETVMVEFVDERNVSVSREIPLDNLAETIRTIPELIREQPETSTASPGFQADRKNMLDDLESIFP